MSKRSRREKRRQMAKKFASTWEKFVRSSVPLEIEVDYVDMSSHLICGDDAPIIRGIGGRAIVNGTEIKIGSWSLEKCPR